jgi:hypothetical protein
MVEQAVAQINLCNMAIGHVAGRPITSINENTVEAEQCNMYFDTALSYVLSDYDWKFCSRRKLLTQITPDEVTIFEADLDGWNYLYQYPSDALKIRKILTANQAQSLDSFGYGNTAGAAYGPANELFTQQAEFRDSYTNSGKMGFGDEHAPEIPFNVGLVNGEKCIFTDVPNARARYTALLNDFTAYDADFAILFSYYLAHLIAYGITRKLELKQHNLTMYESMKNTVKANNTNEGNNPKREPPAPWIVARNGY